MYWLVETEEQLKNLYNKKFEEVFVEIIPFSNTIHPIENDICAVYLKPLNSKKGYIIPISHSETLFIDLNSVDHILNTFKKIYVRDKKEFLHYLVYKTLYDITLHFPPYIQTYTQTHNFFYKQYPNKKDINLIIPIVKHYEYCENTFNELKNRINEPINHFYNHTATLVFNSIEQSGIRIDREKFESHFHNVDSDFVYTKFNFKTTTTRPSNTFKSVNYAALNKNNNERQSFIPRNDIFIELDISAYHPTLLANLVNHNFGDEDIHSAFAKMYGVDYKQAKEITFKQLYGGIFDEYKELEFFKKVQAYVDDLWDTFQQTGQIECPISKHIYKKDELENMYPQKLLNYLLQNLETSVNISILWDMLKILQGCKTKLVLYTYDSFLLDMSYDEKITFDEILKLFKKYKLHTKYSYGKTYDFS
jgi:hypothetical protein